MKIYSFEFASKAIDWYFNTYNEMNFIGTQSYKFPGNRNFIRVNEKIPEDDIKFEKGTYFSPAIEISTQCYVRENPSTKNPSVMNITLSESTYGESSHLAIISVDFNCYRIIGYWLGSDQENGPRPEIIKATNTPKFRACVLEFDKVPDNDSTEAFDILLYNKLFRKYEYYRIYTTNDALLCGDITEDYSNDELHDIIKQAGGDVKNKSIDFELYEI